MKHINMTSTTCSGCKACASVCSKQAISFLPDSEGFLVPHVNTEKCVDCGLCVSTCPALTSKEEKQEYLPKAFALQYHDESVRKNSASGALFPAFANYFINKLNGYVCGCILDDNLTAKHIVSNQWMDVERMQDSKYVQSDMCSCINEIIELLKRGNHVLFSGTSCQVKGLLSALKTKRVETSKLLTIDFFCHGVPSPLIWKEYVYAYERKCGKKINGYKFRNKTYGWGKGPAVRNTGFLSTWLYKGKYHEDFSLLARIWPRIFFSNLCLRYYCHSCPYAKIEKPADITMGDFWGIENFRPDFDDHKGCSMAITHSMNAEKILDLLPATEILEVSIDEVIRKQGNAFAPSKPHVQRNSFWKDYVEGGISLILKEYFDYTTNGRIKALVKYVLFKMNLRKYSY